MRRQIVIILTVILAAGLFYFAPGQAQESLPIVAVDALDAQPGTIVNYIGNGFPADTPLVVGMGSVDDDIEALDTVTSDELGVVSGSVAVPQSALVGESWVLVIATSDRSTQGISLPLTILETPESASVPDLFIAPRVGEPGTEVQVRGINYPPNSEVLVGVGRQLSDFAFSFRVITDENGTFSESFTIPETARPGTTWYALGELEENRDFEAISGSFTVIGQLSPPVVEEDGITSADLYLIALGDGGRSGIEVGCNDSAIPVAVEFDEPTITPLTQLLETLLALDEQVYGRAGLYHAIYPSELTLEGITIEDGLATINLSGGLAIGGECDEPRIRAQIQQTALQFSNIDDVLILVNGIPYEEVVSP